MSKEVREKVTRRWRSTGLGRPIWDDASLARVHEVADKAQRVQAMFDGIEAAVRAGEHGYDAGLDAMWRRRLVKGLELPAGAAVLDIACGTGRFFGGIARARPKRRGWSGRISAR